LHSAAVNANGRGLKEGDELRFFVINLGLPQSCPALLNGEHWHPAQRLPLGRTCRVRAGTGGHEHLFDLEEEEATAFFDH